MHVDRPVVAVVAIGGAAGAAARFGLDTAFPGIWTTFAINVVGCLAIGVLVELVTAARRPWPLARPLLGTGFLGGFTTFSTYANQTRALVHDGQLAVAASYAGATLVCALAATWLGMALARVAQRGNR